MRYIIQLTNKTKSIMDLMDKRDEVLRTFLEYGIGECKENDLTKTDLAECAEAIVKKLTIPVVVVPKGTLVCDENDKKSICNNPLSHECCNKHHKRI